MPSPASVAWRTLSAIGTGSSRNGAESRDPRSAEHKEDAVPLTGEVVSADRVWWEGEARSVSAPALEGDLGILVGHQPILAVLRTGKIRIEAEIGRAHV